MKHDEDAAYPTKGVAPGLTKREYAAIKFTEALILSSGSMASGSPKLAVKLTDELFKELEK